MMCSYVVINKQNFNFEIFQFLALNDNIIAHTSIRIVYNKV